MTNNKPAKMGGSFAAVGSGVSPESRQQLNIRVSNRLWECIEVLDMLSPGKSKNKVVEALLEEIVRQKLDGLDSALVEQALKIIKQRGQTITDKLTVD